MSSSNEIKSEKILIKDVFTKWFNIPGYQRPFVWGYEEIHELLDDVWFATQSKPDSEYFLGSFVYQIKPPSPKKGQPFEENDLLDGQQRMTTLLLLMAVLRDLSDNLELKSTCQECLYQQPKVFINMNTIIQIIDAAASPDEVLSSEGFGFDTNGFLRTLDGPVYGRRFAKYVVLKLDYLYANHAQRMHFETVSIEHILPQDPSDDSQWVKDFTAEQREAWTNKLGNLVVITCRKNSSQGRLDFGKKVQKYFERNIDTCPNSLRVLRTYKQWTPVEIAKNHRTVMDRMKQHYGIGGK